ncbi:MAG: hypothetical protein IJB93_01255 [Clostridia bacterium]|nr:hypothetical protein [Clostridia bacterium]
MKSTDLFIALSEIDEKLIEEAAPKRFRATSKTVIKMALPIAACLCLLIAGALGFYSNHYNRLTPYTYFPEIVFDSMGYEGTDSLALQNSVDINPFSADSMPETLPVFQNKCYSGGLYQNYFSEKELQKNLLKMAENFGESEFQFNTTKAEIDTDDPNYEEKLIYSVAAESEKYCITTNGHCFSIMPKTADASEKLMEYLKTNYDIKNMGECRTYSVDGELLSTEYKAYKKGSTVEESIISFNLSSAEIHFNEDGTIDFAVINDYLNSTEKVMDCKTIPLEKATGKLLLGADVSTSTPEELIIGGQVQKEHIIKADLIYYTNNLQQVFVPSYRFYVKLINPDESSEIENYGLFYVPAVEIDETSGFEVMKNIFQ